jgi:hypothetical protein
MTKPAAWSWLGKSIGAAAVLALLAGGAAAQLPMPGMTISPDAKRPLTDEEKEKQKAIDDKYKATMQSIPDKKAPADPWGNIRTAPATPSKQR